MELICAIDVPWVAWKSSRKKANCRRPSELFSFNSWPKCMAYMASIRHGSKTVALWS